MANKMYWAARCKKYRGMVGFRVVLYTVDALGLNVEEQLPPGTITRRCDHCGTVSDFNLHYLWPTSMKFLVPTV
jgi:hypothetical protein